MCPVIVAIVCCLKTHYLSKCHFFRFREKSEQKIFDLKRPTVAAVRMQWVYIDCDHWEDGHHSAMIAMKCGNSLALCRVSGGASQTSCSFRSRFLKNHILFWFYRLLSFENILVIHWERVREKCVFFIPCCLLLLKHTLTQKLPLLWLCCCADLSKQKKAFRKTLKHENIT